MLLDKDVLSSVVERSGALFMGDGSFCSAVERSGVFFLKTSLTQMIQKGFSARFKRAFQRRMKRHAFKIHKAFFHFEAHSGYRNEL